MNCFLKNCCRVLFMAGLFSQAFAQTAEERKLIAASQADAAPLYFNPMTADVPVINAGKFYDEKECVVRGGMPAFFAKLKASKPVTIAYIGGSITQGAQCYRPQSAKAIAAMFPHVKITWLNAGVSGTGTDLAACRIGEQVLQYRPDLVFVEFAVNGAYMPGMEGIVRQIIKHNPSADICFIYTLSTGQTITYQENRIPQNIQGLEKIADYYQLPSVHMGMEAAQLEKENKLIWKGNADTAQGRTVFSNDGIHPLQAGGNIYAAAILRAFQKMKSLAAKQNHALPAPMIADNWEDGTMADPLTIARFDDNWNKLNIQEHPKLKAFKNWFPYVMSSGKPGASFTFHFSGTAFGFFNIGGPEVGQLSVAVDGKRVKLKVIASSGYRLQKANSEQGNDVIDLFTSYSNNRYRGQYDLVQVPDGEHEVRITISPLKADKVKILGAKQLEDITANPGKYDQTVFYLGKILLKGKALPLPASATAQVYKNSNAPVEARVNDLLSKMTIEEKIDYIGGYKGFYIRGIERLGLPEIKLTDGPVGTHKDGKSTAYPASILSAATWDTALVYQLGKQLGRDSRARGVHILLAPGVNIVRAPMGGRNFEYFSEDPFLTARMGVAYIKGLQDERVVATVKHFAGNNQEWDRNNVSSDIDERTLQEIYLPAFKAAVQEAGAGSVMTSYNLVNGVYASQNVHLNNEILKRDWGFDGFVMSDWSSTYDAVGAANGGLDLEMPRAKFMNRDNLLPALANGKVKQEVIDDKVKRILRVIFRFGFFDKQQMDKSVPMDNPEAAATALELARSGIVVLKNTGNLLPLDMQKIKTLAVIGPNANGYIAGGGSSYTFPFHSVSVVQGLQQVAKQVTTKYIAGLPTLPDRVARSVFYMAPGSGEKGLKGEYYSNSKLQGEPSFTRKDTTISINNGWHIAAENQGIPFDHCSMRWTGVVRPEKSTAYQFTVRGFDGFRLWVDDKQVINAWRDQGITTRDTIITLEAGKDYPVRLEYFANAHPVDVNLAWQEARLDFAPAVDAARTADAAVVCIGFNESSERESNDRTFELPAFQDSLIHCILRANPNTIVLLNAGGNADMRSWINKVPALLHTWYPGQEGGTAIAEILFGKVNPSGKLPVSFEKEWKDNPAYQYYYDPAGTKRVAYKEGIFTGYRYYDTRKVTPAFPFGFGLSYTSFSYSNLYTSVKNIDGKAAVSVSFTVRNTGSRDGAEVAQVYVRDRECAVPRPDKELKGFAKVFLKKGEQKKITVLLNEQAFSYYKIAGNKFGYDPGEFDILIGSSSASVHLQKRVTLP